MFKTKKISNLGSMPGFTMIELMTTVAIVSVFAVAAAPSLGDLVQRNRVQSSVDNFVRVLQAARGEAIKRAAPVTLTPLPSSPSSDNEWGEGVRVWIDLDNDDSFDADELLLQFDALANVKVDAAPDFSKFNFRPTGRVGKVGSNTTYTFDVCASGRSEGQTLFLSAANSRIKRSDKTNCPVS